MRGDCFVMDFVVVVYWSFGGCSVVGRWLFVCGCLVVICPVVWWLFSFCFAGRSVVVRLLFEVACWLFVGCLVVVRWLFDGCL